MKSKINISRCNRFLAYFPNVLGIEKRGPAPDENKIREKVITEEAKKIAKERFTL